MRRLPVFVATALVSLGAAFGGATFQVSADSNGNGASTAVPSASQIIITAERYLGSPYAYIGDDPSTGFSCIGFIHFIFAQNGVYVPEDLSKAYAAAPHVDQSNLQPGDLVFFQNTVWDGVSHVDLYVGAGKMIGADSFETGVQWDALGDPYWQSHYLGATRPISDPSGTPVDPGATPVPSNGPSLAPPTGPSLDITAGTALTPRYNAAVYSGPGYSYTAIDTVSPASTLTVVQTQSQWVDVSYDNGGQFGWIHGPDVVTATAPAARNTDNTAPAATPAASPAPSALPVAMRTDGRGSTAPHVADLPRHDTGKTLVVALDGLPLNTGPGSFYPVLDRLNTGMQVTVLHQQGQWDQIALPDGTQGWVGYQYLRNRTVAPAAGAASGRQSSQQRVLGYHTTTGRMVLVTADVLFVRAGPSHDAHILRRVHAGDRLRVLTADRGWDYVALRDDSRGWVSALYVR